MDTTSVTPDFNQATPTEPSPVEQQARALQGALFYAARQDPKQYARLFQIWKQTGIPPAVSAGNETQIQQMLDSSSIDPQTFTTIAPRVSAWASNPDTAAVASVKEIQRFGGVEQNAAAMRAAAMGATGTQDSAAAPSYAMTATNPETQHQIGTNDGGQSWYDVQTGETVDQQHDAEASQHGPNPGGDSWDTEDYAEPEMSGEPDPAQQAAGQGQEGQAGASQPATGAGHPNPRTAQSPAPQNSPPASGNAAPGQQQTRIGPIQGYPETGDHGWRAANDAIFINAANRYNAALHLSPGDERYVTPKQLKAQAMVESGGTRAAFERDPLQVNNPKDWVKEKAAVAGLKPGQAMTPATSAEAALLWQNHKAEIHDGKGNIVGYRDRYNTLRNYNGRETVHPTGEQHRDWYARTVVNLSK